MSLTADAAREAARTPTGQFGAQLREEPAVDLLPTAPGEDLMPVEEAADWWYEDGSYAIASGAVDLLGDCPDWEGWNLPPDANEFRRELVVDSRRAAAALLAAAAPFDHAVSHGTGRAPDIAVGDIYRIPLVATSDDVETAEHFAVANSEDGAGAMWDFPSGATGVRINDSEWAVTGRYRLADRYVDAEGVEHYQLVPADNA